MPQRFTSGGNTTDPVTGIPIPGGSQRVTQDGSIRVTQTTGEAPYGLNQEPGTSDTFPDTGGPGLPLGFIEVPKTGPLG